VFTEWKVIYVTLGFPFSQAAAEIAFDATRTLVTLLGGFG
jgi:hypothetical protein